MQTEKRLIDMNEVYRRACEGCTRHGEAPGECYHEDPCERLLFAFTTAEPVDAMEVVRCCQCKHGKMLEDGSVLCKFHSEYGDRESRGSAYSVWMEPDDFCSYGERRTDDA